VEALTIQAADYTASACALIKAADDAAADLGYMMDSDDCIAVLRGEWKGGMLNDCPQLPPKPLTRPAVPEGWVLRSPHGDLYRPGQECPDPNLVWAGRPAWRALYAAPQPDQVAGPAVPEARPVIEQCLKALDEELAAYDIDPPIHHVLEARNACAEWLAAAPQPEAAQPDAISKPCPGHSDGRHVFDAFGHCYGENCNAFWAAQPEAAQKGGE
jgi:hypothetical protein